MQLVATHLIDRKPYSIHTIALRRKARAQSLSAQMAVSEKSLLSCACQLAKIGVRVEFRAVS